MSFDWTQSPDRINGICDYCGLPRVSELAESKVEPGVMENGYWVGGYTKEKSVKWREALDLAWDELTKPCIQFETTDCDGGVVCLECLGRFLNEG